MYFEIIIFYDMNYSVVGKNRFLIGCLTEFFETTETDLEEDFALLSSVVSLSKIKITRKTPEGDFKKEILLQFNSWMKSDQPPELFSETLLIKISRNRLPLCTSFYEF